MKKIILGILLVSLAVLLLSFINEKGRELKYMDNSSGTTISEIPGEVPEVNDSNLMIPDSNQVDSLEIELDPTESTEDLINYSGQQLVQINTQAITDLSTLTAIMPEIGEEIDSSGGNSQEDQEMSSEDRETKTENNAGTVNLKKEDAALNEDYPSALPIYELSDENSTNVIINGDNEIRLDPHETEFDPAG